MVNKHVTWSDTQCHTQTDPAGTGRQGSLDLSGEKLFQILINDTNWQYSEVKEKYYTVDGRGPGIYNKDYRFTAKIRF